MGFRFDIAKSDTCMSQYWQWVFNHSFGHHESSCRHDMNLFKRAMSTILSDFLNRNCSPNLEQMWVKIHQKHRKVVFKKYFGENMFASNLCLGYSNSSQSRWLRLCMMNCAHAESVCWWKCLLSENLTVEENWLLPKMANNLNLIDELCSYR